MTQTHHLINRVFSVVCAGLFLAGAAWAAPIATLEMVEGEVWIRSAGAPQDAWQTAAEASPLESGDTVKTAEGSCLLVYADEAQVSLGPRTVITVREDADAQTIDILQGKLNANVDSEKAKKPYNFATPVAVAAVRGTDLDIDFNEEGELTIDLHNGELLVYNDEEDLEIELQDGRKISLYFDRDTGALAVKNDCVSEGEVEFVFGGSTYRVKPCDEIIADVEVAAEGGLPEPPGDDDSEDIPDEKGDTDSDADDDIDTDIPPPVSEFN